MNLAYIDGKVVPLESATVPVTSLAFTLGVSIFEAVRVYWNREKKQYCVFNLKKHIKRLFNSAKIMRMHLSYTDDELNTIINDLVLAWDKKMDGYIRITVYISDPAPGGSVYDPSLVQTKVCITIIEKTADLNLNEGIKCCISSWMKISDNCMPPRVKSACNYENTRLAGHEAILNGYDNAILLNRDGKVSEAAESVIFYVDENSNLITPTTNSDILESINRSLIIDIWKEQYEKTVIEKVVDRTELYLASEMFICNTAKLIRPVISLDRISIGTGNVGEYTKKISIRFNEVVKGNCSIYNHNSTIICI